MSFDDAARDLETHCPTTIPGTALNRLDSIQARLDSTWRATLSIQAEVLPRRFCSVSTAESNLSKSRSSSCLIALGKSPGRICRVFEVARVTPAAGFAREEAARADVREKRSGVVALGRMRPSCRCRPCAATQDRASQGSLSLINFFASSGDLIRPLRGTFVYTALAFDKVGKPFGIRFELVGISQ
jgi:hypothetical protein